MQSILAFPVQAQFLVLKGEKMSYVGAKQTYVPANSHV